MDLKTTIKCTKNLDQTGTDFSSPTLAFKMGKKSRVSIQLLLSFLPISAVSNCICAVYRRWSVKRIGIDPFKITRRRTPLGSGNNTFLGVHIHDY